MLVAKPLDSKMTAEMIACCPHGLWLRSCFTAKTDASLFPFKRTWKSPVGPGACASTTPLVTAHRKPHPSGQHPSTAHLATAAATTLCAFSHTCTTGRDCKPLFKSQRALQNGKSTRPSGWWICLVIEELGPGQTTSLCPLAMLQRGPPQASLWRGDGSIFQSM